MRARDGTTGPAYAGRRKGGDDKGTMFRILVLLVTVAMGCGVATAVTVAHAPTHGVQVERGY
jgi:hypothetical protein